MGIISTSQRAGTWRLTITLGNRSGSGCNQNRSRRNTTVPLIRPAHHLTINRSNDDGTHLAFVVDMASSSKGRLGVVEAVGTRESRPWVIEAVSARSIDRLHASGRFVPATRPNTSVAVGRVCREGLGRLSESVIVNDCVMGED